MAATSICSVSPASLLISSSASKAQQPINRSRCPNFIRPVVPTRTNPTTNASLRVSRVEVSRVITATPKRVFRVLASSGLADGDSETTESGIDDVNKSATIDLELPRRRLLAAFTCNSCGERTKRLVNRLAYERGTVFVQCAGCLQHHQLVDNLGLVVEYDFREEMAGNLNADEV